MCTGVATAAGCGLGLDGGGSPPLTGSGTDTAVVVPVNEVTAPLGFLPR